MIIFKAVKQTDLKKLETIIKKKIDDVNKVDRNGRTPMHYAALDGNLEVVKLFLKYNAKVNPNDNDGYTPLHYAAINGHLEVVQHIVKHSANVNQINNRVNSPVYYALLKGHIRVVLYLVEQGVDVNLADKWGNTPLHYAALYGHIGVLELLLKKDDVDINQNNNDQKSSLFFAATKNHLKAGEILLKYGADFSNAINDQDKSLLCDFYEKIIEYIANKIVAEHAEYEYKMLAFAMVAHNRLGADSLLHVNNNNFNDLIEYILDLSSPLKVILNDIPKAHHDKIKEKVKVLQKNQNTPINNVNVNDCRIMGSDPNISTVLRIMGSDPNISTVL